MTRLPPVTLVEPSATADYVATLCATGQTARYAPFADQTHGTVAVAAMPTVMAWFTAALAGTPPAGSCGSAPGAPADSPGS